MKKVFKYLSIFLLLFLFGCSTTNNTKQDDKNKPLDYQDNKDQDDEKEIENKSSYLLTIEFSNSELIYNMDILNNSSHEEGEELSIFVYMITDCDIWMYVDGVYNTTSYILDTVKVEGYPAWEFKYVMPNHDTKLTFKIMQIKEFTIIDGSHQLDINGEVGEVKQLTYSISKVFDYDKIIWSSRNLDVATIDQNGLLTLVGVGSTIIDLNLDGAHAYAYVHVKEASEASLTVTINMDDGITLAPDLSDITSYKPGDEVFVYVKTEDKKVDMFVSDNYKMSSADCQVVSILCVDYWMFKFYMPEDDAVVNLKYSEIANVIIHLDFDNLVEDDGSLPYEERYQLTFDLEPKDCEYHDVTWSVSDTSVAHITSDGLLRIYELLPVTVTVNVDGVTSSLDVYPRRLSHLIKDKELIEIKYNKEVSAVFQNEPELKEYLDGTYTIMSTGHTTLIVMDEKATQDELDIITSFDVNGYIEEFNLDPLSKYINYLIYLGYSFMPANNFHWDMVVAPIWLMGGVYTSTDEVKARYDQFIELITPKEDLSNPDPDKEGGIPIITPVPNIEFTFNYELFQKQLDDFLSIYNDEFFEKYEILVPKTAYNPSVSVKSSLAVVSPFGNDTIRYTFYLYNPNPDILVLGGGDYLNGAIALRKKEFAIQGEVKYEFEYVYTYDFYDVPKGISDPIISPSEG